ncbi:MAG: nicotinamide riboside transporter PnuC [Bacilli bacterium]
MHTVFKQFTKYFSIFELLLWGCSISSIVGSFFIFNTSSYLVLTASLIGVTSLIFNAKGNPFGQFLMIIFSVLYGIISYNFAYYGEMITYIGMTGPMALFSLLSWLNNPYDETSSQVEINVLSKYEPLLLSLLTLVITCFFYFILKYFNTANLALSTISVSTSFIAVYLTFRRSPFFAIAYGLNDIVLIGLWIIASLENNSYVSVVICFSVFLVNDIYGFVNWNAIKKLQKKA